MTQDELAEAYRRFGPLVAQRCRAIVRDDALAEDALQNVFMRVWRYESHFAAAESKLGWLYRVADRCCFDLLARRRSRRETSLTELPERHAAGQSFEERELVLHFLARFDARTQQVAVLHYLDGLPQEEIARATGWSRQTVWKKLTLLRESAARLRADLGMGAVG
jgi:RNA polymerase sigma-70 factor (ECF subfamily)